MAIDLGNYNDVAARIGEFREKYPDGRLRPVDPRKPYSIEVIDGKTFIVYVAAAYRDPSDKLPGIGAAWEPFPGPTPYTKDSELQNAETSAWGRAMIAALIADAHKGIASAEEVRNRAEANGGVAPAQGPRLATEKQRKEIVRMVNMENATIPNPWPIEDTLTMRDASTILESMKAEKKEPKAERKATLRTPAGETPEGAVPVYADPDLEPF